MFVLSFGVLQKIGIFGNDKKSERLNIILAIVLGLLFVQSQNLVFLLNNFLPNMSMLLVVAVMFLVVLGLFFGKRHEDWTGLVGWLAALIAFGGIIWALFYDNLSRSFDVPYWLYLSDQAKANVLVFGAIILVIWLIVRGTSDDKPGRSGPEIVVRPSGGNPPSG